ncbi:type VI secretion system lipoprotein TssJ [Marinimicrobium sp. ARAG 43.8]|uniref:type VI secretion system lipoprotein TssJ n=1 Tax=Marinimicrobium sp. ARAG 43.8 TaxID=3418719 RepID=UPI003CF6D535
MYGFLWLARLLVLSLIMLWLSGCATEESRVGGVLKLKTNVTLTIRADETINPDHQGVASPVFLRLYELSVDQAFEQADFIDLYNRESTALGNTLVQRRQLPRVLPGDVQRHQLVLDSNTRYLGLVAEFYQYERAVYKVVVPITARNVFRDRIELQISESQISVIN